MRLTGECGKTKSLLSEVCPDCGSSDWRPIAYGLPTKETRERARRGEFVLGGCCFDIPRRLCRYCHNHWPTKPRGGGLSGIPDYRKGRVQDSLRRYEQLCELANDQNLPGVPPIEAAWARIDGTIYFLIPFQDRRLRLIRDPKTIREGGAPTYHFLNLVDDAGFETKAAVAAIRFERSNQPSGKNLYNDWLAVRDRYRRIPEPDMDWYTYSQRRAQRKRTAKLIRFAKTIPFNELPSAERAGPTRFRVFSPDWGYVRVDRTSPGLDLADSFEYKCGYNRNIQQSPDPVRVQAVACAAALLLDFPQLAGE